MTDHATPDPAAGQTCLETANDNDLGAPRREARARARALAKAISWRAIGSLDTFVWSWLITGHAGAAGAIASIETVTKIGLYYGHERLWRAAPWAVNAHSRSLTKAVAWRLLAGLDTFVLSWLVTGNAKFAVSILSIEALTKIGLYYLHERAWLWVAPPQPKGAPR